MGRSLELAQKSCLRLKVIIFENLLNWGIYPNCLEVMDLRINITQNDFLNEKMLHVGTINKQALWKTLFLTWILITSLFKARKGGVIEKGHEWSFYFLTWVGYMGKAFTSQLFKLHMLYTVFFTVFFLFTKGYSSEKWRNTGSQS